MRFYAINYSIKKFSYLILVSIIVALSLLFFLLFYSKSSHKSKPIIKLEISDLSDTPLSSDIVISEKVQNTSSIMALEVKGDNFSDGTEILTPLPDFLSSDLLPMLITGKGSGVVAPNNISENMNDENIFSDAPNAHSNSSGVSDVVVTDSFINERLGQSKSIDNNVVPTADINNIWKVVGAKDESAIIYNSITGETRAVYVGDTIHDIGKIKSIETVNGKWTIIGSNKIIDQ